MSAASTGIPPVIEQQLLALDKQIRDVAFIRGAGRFVLGACLLLGSSLLLDSWLDLSGSIRVGLLVAWIATTSVFLWRVLILPAIQPISFSALAALVEKQFPELSERLTSLVELRGADGDEVAPGASLLMQDLLARQTLKALDRVTVDHAALHQGSHRAVIAGMAAVLILLAPFGWNSDGYGLLWARFFALWGNFGWGANYDLKVLEGDQVVARGSDVNVHVTLTDRKKKKEIGKELTSRIWLNWVDESGASDSRRLDWDDQSQQFLATLPHVRQTLAYDVTATGAKSGTYRVDVSDPPAIAQFKLDIEPAAYTGLPAKTLMGVPGEIRVPEFSRVQLSVDFKAPVSTAELKWPAISDEAPKSVLNPEKKVGIELSVPLELSADRRSGVAQVAASMTGAYVIVAKNDFGLQNNDASRLLTVIPDQPPQIHLDGDDEPILARPDDIIELNVEVIDDYGLTAVELHAETSAGNKRVESVPANDRLEGRVQHKFVMDLSQYELTPGQAVSFRIRAVDNRPHPEPQEVWTSPRTVVINTSLKQLPDRELAKAEQSLEDELSSLRTELNRNKAELTELHQQTEQEALNKQAETDKTERLNQLQNSQDRLIERIQQLADRLGARRMTLDLAPKAQQISDGNLKSAQDRLEQSKTLPARDQLEPLSQSIDNLGAADRQLRQLEDQLVDLNKLEQDLAELSRMAQHAERLADQLDKLDAEQRGAARQNQAQAERAEDSKPEQAADNQSLKANDKNTQTAQTQNEAAQPAKNDATEKAAVTAQQNDSPIPQKLKDEAARLADQMNELLKKHPELLEAARREQLDQLVDLAEQARKLAGPQERLAEALNEAAANAPAVASRPDNAGTPQTAEPDRNPNGDPMPETKQGPPAKDLPTQVSRDALAPGPNAAKSNEALEPKQPNDPPSPRLQRENPSEDSNPASSEKASDNANTNPMPSRKQQDRESKAGKPNADNNAVDASKPTNVQPDADQGKPVINESKSSENPNQAAADASKPTNADAPVADAKKPRIDDTKLTANASQPVADAKSSTNDPDASPKNASRNDSPKNAPPNEKPPINPADQSQQSPQSSPQNPAQQAGSKAAQQQEQIAREATQQALDLARETGADSSATKAAAEFARQADAAKQLAQAGQLAQAANEARKAAGSAEQTARQLDPDGQSNSAQAKQAQQMAERQNTAARQLENLTSSPEAAQGAQLQGQKQLADATSQLAEQMDRAANSLKSAPLNSPKEGKTGEKASQATKQAEQAMKQAAIANQQNDPDLAAKSAANAAQKLKQAADSVPPPPPQNQNSLPVPKSLASKVAEVSKKIESAQQQLSSCNCPNPSASGQGSSTSSPSNKPSQSQPSSNPATAQSQNQNPNSPVSKPQTQVAQANSQPQSSQQQGNKPGQSQQDSKSPSQSSQSTNSQSQKPQGNKPGNKPGQGQQGSVAEGQIQKDGSAQTQKSQGDKPSEGQSSQSQEQGTRPPDSKATGKNSDSSPSQNQQPDKSDQPSQVGNNQQIGSNQKPTDIAQAADKFREVAAMLRQTRGDPKENLSPAQLPRSARPGQPMPGEIEAQSESGESGSNASGTTATVDLSDLDTELQKQARHNWGRLPGQLRTEILQGAGKKSHPEYTQRIKSYFDEITKPAK